MRESRLEAAFEVSWLPGSMASARIVRPLRVSTRPMLIYTSSRTPFSPASAFPPYLLPRFASTSSLIKVRADGAASWTYMTRNGKDMSFISPRYSWEPAGL